ncbi:MAG: TonB-dependent receptor [Nevskiaceae bacterium]|nr:TonB-dependent receptor [Nevskiaceae bacterium]
MRLVIGLVIASAPAASVLAQEIDSEALSEVVVSGSRIVRDGMSAPTPVSVVDADRLTQRAATNIGDMLNELPSFRASSTTATGAAAGGYVGGRILDLRGLGSSRTLILVDGKRFVPSTTAGTVDTNMIPSSLLSRAEVVTGGASAAYGSDAVAGVVNFLLNENLTGMRGSISYSQTTYGDNDTLSASLAGGLEMAGGRVHTIAAIEYEKSKGISDCLQRDWCAEGWTNVGRPAGRFDLPANNIVPNNHESTISPTGVVNASTGVLDNTGRTGTLAANLDPLRGITFNPDTTPRLFQYGFPASAVWMSGGEGPEKGNFNFSGSPIVTPNTHYTLYTRTRFDITDTLIGRLDLSAGHVEGTTSARMFYNTSFAIPLTNPYIPASTDPSLDIRTLVNNFNADPANVAAGRRITGFQLGRVFNEYGWPQVSSRNNVVRAVASLEGKLAGSWGWDAYYQYGRNDFLSEAANIGRTDRVNNALNAVTNAAGNVVCAINNDANTANDDGSCIPLNPFGSNLDPRHRDYLLGTSVQTNVMTQHAMAANVQGDLFNTWAGAVPLAGGVEYRIDKLAGDADEISRGLLFVTNNATPLAGRINVLEGYLETIVPLAKGVTFAETLELNGAIRRTHYEREGAGNSSTVDVTTWKVGLVWEPISSLRFRATSSTDIRAPNVTELFGPVTQGFGILSDPGNEGAQANPRVISGSNPNLVPEAADTTTVGVVIRPQVDGAIGRMQLSVDYYDIQIDDAIGVLGAQTIATRCNDGATEFCSLITRDANNFIQQVSDVRQNVDQLITRGFDVEFSYRQPLNSWGDLDLRLLGSYNIDLITRDSAGETDRAGQNGLRAGTPAGVPTYTIDTLLNWTKGAGQLSLHFRYIPSGFYNASFIGPDDPNYRIESLNSSNLNRVIAARYFDLVGQYDFSQAGDGGFVVFGAVNNINNQDPTRTPGANGVGNNVLFPPMGRTWQLGVRFQFQ